MGRRAGRRSRLQSCTCLPLELRLTPSLCGLHARDLVPDRCDEALPLGELTLDRALLGCALGDDLRLAGAVAAELRTALAHLVPELPDVLQHLCVLPADALGHVEAVEQVVEALRAEDHLDRAARVAVDVEGAQPLRDVHLRRTEARPRDHEMPSVRLQVGVDLRELDGREVVRLRRVTEPRVEVTDLRQHRLSLLALRRDGGVGRRRACGEHEEHAESRERRYEERGRSPSEERHAPSQPPVERPADGGVTGHKSGSLAAPHDVCTANRRENICKQPRFVWYGPRPCAAACAIPRAVHGDRPPGMRRSDVGRRTRSGRPARNAHARAALGGARALRRRIGRRAGARSPPCGSKAGGRHSMRGLRAPGAASPSSAARSTQPTSGSPTCCAGSMSRAMPTRSRSCSALDRCRRCSPGSTSLSARRTPTAASRPSSAPARARSAPSSCIWPRYGGSSPTPSVGPERLLQRASARRPRGGPR